MEKLPSVNRLAWRLVEKLCEKPEIYGVHIEKSSRGVTIIDAGIKAKGGFRVGKIITEICMGGCGKTRIAYRKYGETELPSIFVYTDHPVIATLGSQFAGWQIKEGDYFAIGSGPARAISLKPKGIYEKIGYKDVSDRAVIVLETDKYPPERLLDRFSKDCSVQPKNLAVILTPTASLAGAIQVSGRIVETGIHKLNKLGLDPNVIVYAWGCAPIPPLHPKFTIAMARTNDAILYGGIVHLIVDYEDDGELENFVRNAPSGASRDYGRPFVEIFKDANYDFYKIDPNLFAPAVLTVNNIRTGNTFKAGKINVEVLVESLGFKLERGV